MISRTTRDFWDAYNLLPARVQEQAKRTFIIWKESPGHPSLHFKPVRAVVSTYSVRVGEHYRALAIVRENTAYWFWIGTHAEYDRILRQL